MIFFVVTHPHYYTISRFLASWGHACRQFVRVISYDSLLGGSAFRAGAYVFCDLERLSARQAEQAAIIWTVAAERWGTRFVLNHPTLSCCRFELLRTLRARGLNRHSAARADDVPIQLSFPVFIRREEEHDGSDTKLIHSQCDLDRTILELRQNGACMRNRLVVEYCDVSEKSGRYNLCGAYRLGEEVFGAFRYASHQWQAKGSNRIVDEEQMLAEREYLESNPYREYVQTVFDLGRIQYGRLDFSPRGSCLEAWEINTNPTLPAPHHATDRGEQLNREIEGLALGQALNRLNTEWERAHGSDRGRIRWRRFGARWIARGRPFLGMITAGVGKVRQRYRKEVV